jgi:hypothetical protein
MATAPLFESRDSLGFTQNLVFTTNQGSVVLSGTIDVNTSAVQVSINGGPFVSDPTLVKIDLGTFTIPNLTTYPSGLLLEFGDNVIQVRAIDIVGGVSGASTATISRVQAIDLVWTRIPSGIRLRRMRNAVTILAATPDADIIEQSEDTGLPIVYPVKFLGFHVYASTSPAGVSGLFRINEKIIQPVVTAVEEDILIQDDIIASWPDSARKFVRIRVTEEDEFGNELNVRLDDRRDVNTVFHRVRLRGSLEQYRLNQFVSFRHNRAGGTGLINSEQFAGISNNDPLYYVVSAIYYNNLTGEEVETPTSQEVVGSPLIIDTAIKDLPGRVEQQILVDYVRAVQRVNSEIALIPGSTTRDVSIDPFTSEAERIWFLLDFVHRSQSFLTLLQIDDANGDGISDDVASSAYKTALKDALGFTTDAAVQHLLDTQFDKLARNHGKTRLPGRPAVGQAVIYTPTRPLKNIPVPAGTFVSTDTDSNTNTPSVRFRVGGTFVLPAANADAYFNFDTKQYELTVDIIAETIGTDGNRSATAIKNIQGVPGVRVTNRAATTFGTNQESNAGLAERTMLGPSSVDTGTEGGYAATAAEEVGIVKSKIVKSGDALMMRDYDPVRHKHIGGKVDIWVQGIREREVTEKFAFTFEIARDVLVQIIDLSTLTFRVLDSRVTLSTPIVEILNNSIQGLGVHNVSAGQDYDLTGVVILDYQTFRIDSTLAQPVTHLDDSIVADYRFRVVNQFRFTLQPVRRVVSVVGEVAGPLDPSVNYLLYKNDDPLLTGESTIAKDYLSILQANGKPSGNTIQINNETHVLIGFVQEPLDTIGVNTKTIRVFNQARTVEYDGPGTLLPDFEIIVGTPTSPAKIVRTASSLIKNGQSVSVDYTHDENFTVTYVINDLLQDLQHVVNNRRHTTADVLVKQAVLNQIDIETTVQLKRGATKDTTDPAIHTSVSLELNQKLIGQGSAQSDIINAVDSTQGVDYQIVPLAKMAYADGSRKLRETILSDFVPLPILDIVGNIVYMLLNPLQSPTTDGGGLDTEHRGVFQDDESMSLSSSLLMVGGASNQAFIIGATGADITGYSDDATLTAAGFLTVDARTTERLRRTANHVVVSLLGASLPTDDPGKHTYSASYVIRGDKNAHDIFTTQVEYIDLGAFTITYREATT